MRMLLVVGFVALGCGGKVIGGRDSDTTTDARPTATSAGGGTVSTGGARGSGGTSDNHSVITSAGGVVASGGDVGVGGTLESGGTVGSGGVARGDSSGSGGMSGDGGSGGMAEDGGQCTATEKFCFGQCMTQTPSVGCGHSGCTPCPAAPPNGVVTCTLADCDFICFSGFHKSAALDGCDPDCDPSACPNCGLGACCNAAGHCGCMYGMCV